MRPIAVYSTLRLGLFVVCLALAIVLGARGWLAVLLAAVVSLALSFVILRRQRDSVARALMATRATRTTSPGRFSRYLREDEAAEDAAADEAPR